MEKITKYLMPTFYIGLVLVMIISTVLVISGVENYISEEEKVDFTLDDVFNSDVLPVIKTQTDSIVRPYISETVKVGTYFYDYEGEEKNQEQSILYFENTYMQNTGVDYVSENDFDVICILDGEVISIEDSEIYGKVLTIKHNDNLKSIYSNIKDIEVKVGDKVSQMDILGTSSKNILNDRNESKLHFEVNYKGNYIDPENLYTMKVSDFE